MERQIKAEPPCAEFVLHDRHPARTGKRDAVWGSGAHPLLVGNARRFNGRGADLLHGDALINGRVSCRTATIRHNGQQI